MKTLLIFLALLLLLALVVAAKIKKGGRSTDRFPYKKNANLFSSAERSFLGVLQQAIEDEYFIFGKVRVADVVSVHATSNKSAWQQAFNRISAKHFDYVLCSKSDLSVVCCIELDDQSHRQSKRQARDTFLDGLCSAVSLPLVRVTAKQAYVVAEIRASIRAAIGNPDLAIRPLPSAGNDNGSKPKDKEVKQSEAPTCPKCRAAMVERLIKTGTKAGDKYWGCSAFPKCTGVTLNQ